MPDFHLIDHGSIALLDPLSDDARAWCARHLPDDATRWGDAYAVERRYLHGVVEGIVGDGLVI